VDRSRVKSVDVIRGFAVLWMVLFHTLDFFVNFQKYGRTWYHFLVLTNWLPTFMFVSGMSVWLMVNKRLGSGFSRWKILLHGLKRYVSYIFLGLILCLWLFDFQSFLDFNEILVAIGVYALVTLCLLLVVFGTEWIFLPLAFVVYALSFWFRGPLGSQALPFYLMLPFCFLGAFSVKFVIEKDLNKLTLFELLLLVAIVILAFLGDSFSYVEDSLGFVVYNVLLIIVLFVIVDNFQHMKILNVFSFAGRNALFFYVFYFAVWSKLAAFLDTSRTFDWPSSILLTSLSVAVIFLCAHLKSRILQYFRKIVLKPKSV
jgi:uncharacterized membrane protein